VNETVIGWRPAAPGRVESAAQAVSEAAKQSEAKIDLMCVRMMAPSQDGFETERLPDLDAFEGRVQASPRRAVHASQDHAGHLLTPM
jgi:hypothetical protein